MLASILYVLYINFTCDSRHFTDKETEVQERESNLTKVTQEILEVTRESNRLLNS